MRASDSYLIEITRDIPHTRIWTEPRLSTKSRHRGAEGHRQMDGIAALDEGIPLTLIGEAVSLAAQRHEGRRVAAQRCFRARGFVDGDKGVY